MTANCEIMKTKRQRKIKMDPEEIWDKYIDSNYHDEIDDYKSEEASNKELDIFFDFDC